MLERFINILARIFQGIKNKTYVCVCAMAPKCSHWMHCGAFLYLQHHTPQSRPQCVQRQWNGSRVRWASRLLIGCNFLKKSGGAYYSHYSREMPLIGILRAQAHEWRLVIHHTQDLSYVTPKAACRRSLTDWLRSAAGAIFILISLFNSLTHGCSNMGIERNCQPIKVMKVSGVEAFRPGKVECWFIPPMLVFFPPICFLSAVFFRLALIVSALLFVLGEYLFCSLDWLKGAVWSFRGAWVSGLGETRQSKANVWFSLVPAPQIAATTTGEITKWLQSGFRSPTRFSEGLTRAYKS